MSGEPVIPSDWDQYRLLILNALERIDKEMRSINEKIDKHNGDRGKEISELQVQVGMLKVQAMGWAALASVVVSVIVAALARNWH